MLGDRPRMMCSLLGVELPERCAAGEEVAGRVGQCRSGGSGARLRGLLLFALAVVGTVAATYLAAVLLVRYGVGLDEEYRAAAVVSNADPQRSLLTLLDEAQRRFLDEWMPMYVLYAKARKEFLHIFRERASLKFWEKLIHNYYFSVCLSKMI